MVVSFADIHSVQSGYHATEILAGRVAFRLSLQCFLCGIKCGFLCSIPRMKKEARAIADGHKAKRPRSTMGKDIDSVSVEATQEGELVDGKNNYPLARLHEVLCDIAVEVRGDTPTAKRPICLEIANQFNELKSILENVSLDDIAMQTAILKIHRQNLKANCIVENVTEQASSSSVENNFGDFQNFYLRGMRVLGCISFL
ncbi:hypothetical protein L7F22_000501 [Adiantum nelumboides]|nr:hypothetical protein [Adiantum nelumboides]